LAAWAAAGVRGAVSLGNIVDRSNGACNPRLTKPWWLANKPRLLRRNVKRFQGGLVFKAHRLMYHSTLGLRAIKKKKTTPWRLTNKPRRARLCAASEGGEPVFNLQLNLVSVNVRCQFKQIGGWRSCLRTRDSPPNVVQARFGRGRRCRRCWPRLRSSRATLGAGGVFSSAASSSLSSSSRLRSSLEISSPTVDE